MDDAGFSRVLTADIKKGDFLCSRGPHWDLNPAPRWGSKTCFYLYCTLNTQRGPRTAGDTHGDEGGNTISKHSSSFFLKTSIGASTCRRHRGTEEAISDQSQWKHITPAQTHTHTHTIRFQQSLRALRKLSFMKSSLWGKNSNAKFSKK